MSKLSESLSAFFAKNAEWLGMKPTEAKQLDRMLTAFSTARADNADQMEALKDEVRKLTHRVLQKKKEADSSRGEIKRMIIGEIEGIFREIDRTQRTVDILSSKSEQYAIGLSKVREAKTLLDAGKRLPPDTFDDLALLVQELAREMKERDASVRDLERDGYEKPAQATVNVSQRVGELEGSKETPSELSESTLKRLKELE
jgi:uncharacterized phage infection (PIP) family protein YhgE